VLWEGKGLKNVKGIEVILFLSDRPLRRNARQAVDLFSSTELWYLGFGCWKKQGPPVTLSAGACL
jgi:hypothetical protein